MQFGVALAYLLQFIFYGIDGKRNVYKYSLVWKWVNTKASIRIFSREFWAWTINFQANLYVIHNFSPLLCKAADSILQCKEMFGMIIIKLYLPFRGSLKDALFKESLSKVPLNTLLDPQP